MAVTFTNQSLGVPFVTAVAPLQAVKNPRHEEAMSKVTKLPFVLDALLRNASALGNRTAGEVTVGDVIGDELGGFGDALVLMRVCDSNTSVEWKMVHPVCSTKFSSFLLFLVVTMALAIITLLTVLGNTLVLFALCRYRSLRTMSNCLIGNLAVSDLLLALTVLPISTGHDLLGYWVFGRTMCTIWLCIDVLYCTASIWGLCTIAFDRYTATVFPVWYHDKRSTAKALAYIGFVWIFSIIISVAPLIGWQDMISGFYTYTPAINRHDCILFSTKSYVIYSALGSFILPSCLMTFLYVKIFVVLHKQSKTMKRRSSVSGMSPARLARRCPRIAVSEIRETSCVFRDITTASTVVTPEEDDKLRGVTATFSLEDTSRKDSDEHGDERGDELSVSLIRERRSNSLKVELEALRSPNNICAGDKNYLTVSACDIPKQFSMKKSKSVSSCMQQNGNCKNSPMDSPRKNFRYPNTPRSKSASMLSSMSEANLEARHSKLSLASIHRLSLPWQMERNNHLTTSMRRRFQMREQRATKRMLLIMACFFICWMPFTLMYMLRSLCQHCQHLDDHTTAFIIWLGYANSSLNPVLYTLFNEDFRKAFKKILNFKKHKRPCTHE
ncbi:hypothetical protein C0Q70_10340 [Pomacea canaliculata]|uniref:G-protein coupled receptors family 1 profile domain-containing protein n=1 Tax=Pomacea canaliculata TaxID=400727 RepID=A0A2T7PCB6_POMCA|nr:octopamine receptor 2-like [Pomacea canaliculata]XP_025093771.1 octopamine receptor 2-like [Pomacea canaliculata]PVD31063.1 hypothetical protein C0Q70_10340 [Pomacea canaliculata]